MINTQLKRGLTNPILGWNSDSFYNKEITNVIYAKHAFNKSFYLTTNIQIEN